MIKTKLSSSRKESYRTMDGWESFLMCDARFLIFFIRSDCSDFEMAHLIKQDILEQMCITHKLL